jgi:hypothetical protein
MHNSESKGRAVGFILLGASSLTLTIFVCRVADASITSTSCTASGWPGVVTGGGHGQGENPPPRVPKKKDP